MMIVSSARREYTCPICGTNAWAKPDTQLICGTCYDGGDGEAYELEAEELEESAMATVPD
jgi:hypothetical protein